MVLWRESEEQVAAVRSMLFGLARRRLPGWSVQDREDLVHDALIKALAQHQLPGGTPLEIRARVTFKDVLVDRFRAAGRHREEPSPDPEDRRVDPRAIDARLQFAALCADINAKLGPEILSLVKLRALGFTYAEIAELPNWNLDRVDRVRKQLWRSKGQLEDLAAAPNPKRQEAS